MRKGDKPWKFKETYSPIVYQILGNYIEVVVFYDLSGPTFIKSNIGLNS